MDKISWAGLTRSEIAGLSAEGALVIIPTGAIEQHGDHLSVDTDIRLAETVARLAAGRIADFPVVVAPPVTFGFSPHHSGWPGTISLRLSTYLAMLSDIARSVLDAGFPRALFVNGHGGNEAPLRSLVTEMVTDGYAIGMVNYFSPSDAGWKRLLKGALPRAGHACEQETNLMLALPETGAEERKRMLECVRGLAPRTTQPWIMSGEDDPITAGGGGWPPVFQQGDCGYYGDPAAADPDNAAAMLEVTVAGLARFIEGFARAPLRVGAKEGMARPAGAKTD